jgi:DNA-binding MarR family transcriptional regulator
MEKKGLVIRQGVPGDARLKKLTLTERAVTMHLQHIETIDRFDAVINGAITAEEKNELLRIFGKLSDAVKKLASKNEKTEN